MSHQPSTITSAYFRSVFNSALDTYNAQTGHDLALHQSLHTLQSCRSAHDILSILREQIPASGQSRDRDENFSKWLIPTVNVLFALSASLGEGIGIVNILSLPLGDFFSYLFLRFSHLPKSSLQASAFSFSSVTSILPLRRPFSYSSFRPRKTREASQDNLVELFNRIGYFLHRLEIYTEVQPTTAMTEIIVEIMVEVLTILAIATKETKRGRFGKYLNSLMGNTNVIDALQRLDRLTQEEARMASVELLKLTHTVDSQGTRYQQWSARHRQQGSSC
ncbi:hypothetical protein F5148DRAFT_1146997 [Russula earlei]|uniref:Uncharacterized protein n=1 Tax=Russula earlei TaxID=71964 RepID=A0ACC0UHV4_9AGAM|nr:hypothetical protein F5148DRAFT_1146997 [Russula earlei]